MRLRHLSRVALAAALSLQILPMIGVASARAEEPLRILILPIVVHSASANPTHVSGGLSEMIASRLEQSGRAVVERPEDASLATSQLGNALREGRARRADFVIFGAFTQFGDGASLDIHCAPVQVASEAEAAAARRIFIQSGEVGEIIPRIDEIAGRLDAYVNDGRPAPTVVASPEGGAIVAAPPLAGDALREIADRLEALEEAVFGGAEESASTAGEDAPPES